MDLLIAKRGSILRQQGEIAVSSDRKTLLSQYMRSAFLDTVRMQDIPVNRESELRSPSQLAIRQAEIQTYVIDTIMSSPYGSDFIRSNFSVTTTTTAPDSFKLRVDYKDPVDDGIVSEDFSIRGGVLDLPLNEKPGYEPTFKNMILFQDLIIEDAVDVISTASLVDGFCAVCPAGTQPRRIQVTKDVRDIPDDERKSIELTQTRTVLVEGEGLDSFTTTTRIGVPDAQDGRPTPNDSVFLRSLLPSLTANDMVVSITDNKGNIISSDYDGQAEDYLITFDPDDPVLNITCELVTGIARSVESKVEDVINYAERRLYPFESDWIRSPRLVVLDVVLEPGVYSLYYRAKVPVQYDASMETA